MSADLICMLCSLNKWMVFGSASPAFLDNPALSLDDTNAGLIDRDEPQSPRRESRSRNARQAARMRSIELSSCIRRLGPDVAFADGRLLGRGKIPGRVWRWQARRRSGAIGSDLFQAHANATWVSTLAGRLGFTGPGFDHWLFYAKGGGGWDRIRCDGLRFDQRPICQNVEPPRWLDGGRR